MSRQIGSGTTRFNTSPASEASPHHTVAALALAALLCLVAMAPASAQEPLTFTDAQGRTATFPSGLRSFADEAVGRFLGDPAPRPGDAKAASALGGPDGTAMVLGCGGSAVLAFRDNALVDIDGPDLYIFEVGADVEATSVEISTDGSSWVAIGSAGGATSSVDIGPHVAPGDSFHFVRLTDLKTACGSGGYPGADIDAVGAIGSVTETEPEALTCTGLELSADKPSLPIGEIGVVSWAFAPAGCKPPAVDNPITRFTAAHEEILELDIYFPGNSVRQLGDFAPLYYRGTAIGGSEIRATFGVLTGTAAIAVVDRPRCTGMQISVSSATVVVGGVSKLLVPDVNLWGVPVERPGTELTPAGCSVADDSPAVVMLDRPDRAQIDRSDIRGVAPGPVGVFAVFAGLTATARFEVIPPPPCDSLTYDVPQIAVGEVTGVAYRGGPYLDYSYRGAPMGQEKICIKPAGAPYFEALNLHASVDRDTGAVTGVSPGRARIGAVHGELIGIDDFTVTDVKVPCTSFRISYLRYLPFRGTARPSVAYEPTDCDPPQGLATFSASPIGPVSVSLDGSIFGSAPGKAKVTMRHGQLSAISDDIEVAQLRPCTTMTGSFEPPAISPGRPTRLSVSYGPFPCQPPEGQARVNKPYGGYHWEIIGVEGVDGKERQAWTIATGRSWREDDRFWKDHVFEVPITHGQLSTQVSIPSDDDPCRFGEIGLSSDSVRVGQTIRVEVAVSGEGCAPFLDLLGDGGDGFVRISLDGKAFTVRGIHGGLAWLYGPINRVHLSVESEPCTTLKLTMYDAVISPGMNAYSILSYEPKWRCWPPAGDPTFEIDAPRTVELGGSGMIRALAPGIATVTVRHGQLMANATVEVRQDR